jgi:hypothetical protein
MLQGCSSEEDSGNPGFVQLESVSGMSERDYNRNFDEPRIDIHKEPMMVESDRVLKLKSKDNKTSGTIVFSESGGVGYVYEKGVKKEVVVTADVQGELWAVDADGNSYPISGK